MKGLSAGGMLLFVLTGTFAAFDWLMSLEPEWFSSIYGLLFIAGGGLATLAVAILGLAWQARQHEIGDGWIQPFNDLGNFLLGRDRRGGGGGQGRRKGDGGGSPGLCRRLLYGHHRLGL